MNRWKFKKVDTMKDECISRRMDILKIKDYYKSNVHNVDITFSQIKAKNFKSYLENIESTNKSGYGNFYG